MPRWDVSFDLSINTTDPGVVALVARIHALSRVIRDIPIPPGVQDRIDQLNILRAVRGTTGIEGSDLSEQQVRQVLEAPPGKRVLPASRAREEKEVRNAEGVMRYVAELVMRLGDPPLNENIIRHIHRLTTEGIEYPKNQPGVYRAHDVSVGEYLPPKGGQQVRELMPAFVDWFNSGPRLTWDAAVRALVAHFYVISIHPFGDGNGRTARGIESFLLFKGGINARGFYSLANFYYRERADYVRMLDHVRFYSSGDLAPFVLFGLGGLVAELESVHDEIIGQVTLIAFRDFARETLGTHGKLGTKPGERMLSFLLDLTSEPVSLRDLRRNRHPLARHYRGVTNKTLARDINFLTAHELVVIEGDQLIANLAVMTRFVPPFARKQ